MARIRAEIGNISRLSNPKNLMAHAGQIAVDETLRLALPCEAAAAHVAYIGSRHLPLGTLLEQWCSQRHLAPEERHYFVGCGGSPLSGSGKLWGFGEESDGFIDRRFDGRLALALLQHPLVEPFQGRLARGEFLRIGQVVEKLGLR